MKDTNPQIINKSLRMPSCSLSLSLSLLTQVAAKGDVSELERMYQADPDCLAVSDKKGATTLHHAAAHNQAQAILFLANRGADVDAQDSQGRTPLHAAVAKDAPDAVDALMNCGADPGLTDNEGDAPLHLAVSNNKLGPLERLLVHDTKVDLYQGDRQGRTPLHLAAKFDYDLCAKYLLNSLGFTRCPNQPCSNGYHPIHIAARNASVRVLELLLQYKESQGCIRQNMISIPDLEGNVPLHLAVHGGEIKAVELCLRSGALISSQQDDRSTPVHLACSQGSFEIVKLMFTLQPQEKVKALGTLDAQGMSPLHCAAMFNHPQLVAYLVQEGAAVDQVDQEHRSALLLAAAHSGWRTVDVLLAHGANPNIRDLTAKNLLHIVIMNGGSLSDLLALDHAKEYLPSPCTSGPRWKSQISAMLNEQDSLGWSPLHYACRSGQISSLASLLRLGACVRTKDNRNESPLHFAAKYGRYNTVRHLVESSSGFLILNECNDEGKTALHIASEEGHTRVVQLLLSKGALLHRDHQGRTPLHLAAAGGHGHTITALLAVHSHTLDQVDKDGNTPLHAAVRANRAEVVTQLLSLNCKLLENNNKCKPIDCSIQYKLFESSLALATHPRGPSEMLSTSSKVNGCVCLALIRTLPKVYEAVLDQAIVKADVKDTSKDFFVKYSFYPLQINEKQLESERIKAKDPKFRPLPLYACNAMVECGRIDLLMHPLTQKYLDMKWQAYGKYIHLSNLFMYLIFLSLVTTFAVGILGSDNSLLTAAANTTIQSPHEDKMTIRGIRGLQENKGWMYCMGVAILFFAALSILKEIIQLYHHRFKYLMEAINVIEWTMYVTSVCMVMPVFLDTSWGTQQHNSASLAVFTAWFTLLLYFQRFDRIGIYIVMFLEILNTLIKVLLVFSVLIVAFGFAFFILMSQGGHLSFSNVPMSMMHTFSMMLGEVDFLSIFVYPFYRQSVRGDVLLYPRTTFILLMVFMVLMPILLMNLLIGLAVGDIESVKKNAQLKRIAMQVSPPSPHTGEPYPNCVSTPPVNPIPTVSPTPTVNLSQLCLYPNSEPIPTVSPTPPVNPIPTVSYANMNPIPTVSPTPPVNPIPTVSPTPTVNPYPNCVSTPPVNPIQLCLYPNMNPYPNCVSYANSEPLSQREPYPTVSPTPPVNPIPTGVSYPNSEPYPTVSPTPPVNPIPNCVSTPPVNPIQRCLLPHSEPYPTVSPTPPVNLSQLCLLRHQ
ncbi:transient receptor potential cation channel subfamily A member 1-like [Panulirus ornatus]|uniref:transient receptor potential cation channel subfamily A member 1-like n=1 Tax=Panulirus ornatus TaxID=150431 RepID=UPI003A8AD6C5